MRFPHYIILAFGLFMAFIITLVIKTYHVNNELVSEDYYGQELKYQEKINKMSHLNPETGRVKYQLEDNQIKLLFPATSHDVTGTIEFFRPSNASMDRVVAIKVNEKGEQDIDKSMFARGLYKMKIDWVSEGISYYMEEDIYMQF